MKRYLVTGHAGFIGFHVVQALLAAGATVVGIDSISDYYDPKLKRDRLGFLGCHSQFEHREFSIEERDRLVGEVVDFEPDVIIHLAAQAGVRYSLEAPETYVSTNLVGTFNLLEAARLSPPKHLMLASSSSIYGGNEQLPWAEIDRADAPVSLYAATKKGVENLAHSYAHLWRIPTTGFRFFTVYGPWGRPDMALFKFVKSAFSGEKIDVYGHGKMSRDFTYIDDLVSGILALAETPPQRGQAFGPRDSLSPVAPFRVVNIGTGAPIKLLDFISAVEESTGVELSLRMLPMQPGDVTDTFADTTLMRALIGELPSTSIERGVECFVDWYKSYYGTDGVRSHA